MGLFSIKSFNHKSWQSCIEKLASSNKSDNSDLFNIDNTLINMKEYDGCNLMYKNTWIYKAYS